MVIVTVRCVVVSFSGVGCFCCKVVVIVVGGCCCCWVVIFGG